MRTNKTPIPSPRPAPRHIGIFLILLANLAISLFPLPTAQAQDSNQTPIQITTTTDRSQIRVGEHVTAKIRIQWPASGVRVLPLSLGDQIGAFEILDIQESGDKANKKGLLERNITLKATTFEIGPLEFGPVEIPYFQDSDSDELKTLLSKSVSIEVVSVLPEGDAAMAAEIRPVKPPLEMPFNRKFLLVLSGIALLILILAVLAFWLLKRYCKKEETEAPPAPLLDPDEEALRALAEIETSRMLERDTAKACYTRLSHILRRYLGRRHRFDALEMTSFEVLLTIEQVGWSPELWNLLDEDLREADAVKFAKYSPDIPKRRTALDRVRRIVMSTRPGATLRASEEVP